MIPILPSFLFGMAVHNAVTGGATEGSVAAVAVTGLLTIFAFFFQHDKEK